MIGFLKLIFVSFFLKLIFVSFFLNNLIEAKEINIFEYFKYENSNNQAGFSLGITNDEKALSFKKRDFFILDKKGKEHRTKIRKIKKALCYTQNETEEIERYFFKQYRNNDFYMYFLEVDAIESGIIIYPVEYGGFYVKQKNQFENYIDIHPKLEKKYRTREKSKNILKSSLKRSYRSNSGEWILLATGNKHIILKNNNSLYERINVNQITLNEVFGVFSKEENDYFLFSCFNCNQKNSVLNPNSAIVLGKISNNNETVIKSSFIPIMPSYGVLCDYNNFQEIWPNYKFIPRKKKDNI